MTELIDETGNIHGKLAVVRRAENTVFDNVQWLCRCKCGNEVVVRGSSLRRKQQTRSCGCLRSDNSLPNGDAAFNKLLYVYKRNAQNRGLEWQLISQQFRQLTSQSCHYCGIVPKQVQFPEGDTGVYVYNGVDRVDNNKGYTPDNCVSCCGVCNYAKANRTALVFLAWASRIHSHNLRSI